MLVETTCWSPLPARLGPTLKSNRTTLDNGFDGVMDVTDALTRLIRNTSRTFSLPLPKQIDYTYVSSVKLTTPNSDTEEANISINGGIVVVLVLLFGSLATGLAYASYTGVLSKMVDRIRERFNDRVKSVESTSPLAVSKVEIMLPTPQHLTNNATPGTTPGSTPSVFPYVAPHRLVQCVLVEREGMLSATGLFLPRSAHTKRKPHTKGK